MFQLGGLGEGFVLMQSARGHVDWFSSLMWTGPSASLIVVFCQAAKRAENGFQVCSKISAEPDGSGSLSSCGVPLRDPPILINPGFCRLSCFRQIRKHSGCSRCC